MNRATYHAVLDRILDNLTDAETADGIVDVIVQVSNNYDKPERFERLVIQALCCPTGQGITLDDLTKTLCTDTTEGDAPMVTERKEMGVV